MRYIQLFSFLTLLFLSCSGDIKNKKPKDLISKNEMASIIADISIYKQSPTGEYIEPVNNIIIDSIKPDSTYEQTPLDKISEKATHYSLQTHSKTLDNFQSSFDYYHQTEKMAKIYEISKEILKNKLPEK